MHRHITGKTPLTERSVRRRSRKPHNKHRRRKSIPSMGFEPTANLHLRPHGDRNRQNL